MTTLLELPDDLMGAVERRAVRDGCDLASAVADLLRRGLAASPPLPVEKVGNLIRDPATGLLMAVCDPNAPASRMTAAELIALEQATQTEEDLERLGIVV